VKEQEAKGAMDAMLRVVERIGRWKENSFTSRFSSKSADCRQLLADNNPSFAITSLGLFLEQRDRHNLVPVAQPRINGRVGERYRVMVQKGKFKTIEQLKGKSLGGTILDEPEFLRKIVFAGKLNPADFFDLKPSKQAIRTLRALDKGDIDAVILNEQQYAGLGALALTTPFEAIFTSEELPLMGLVADSKTSTADERARFANALESMCADADGKKLCDLFGVESFVAVDPAVFEPVIQQWAGRR
jgi:ABC-type amino acid transport substrate-binding protein